MLLSLVASLAVTAGPPETWVVVSRRSGVLPKSALELTAAVQRSLAGAGVPSTLAPEDLSDCKAKKPCLLEKARAKKAAVIVTLDVGAVLEELVAHVEALSVEEDGKKIGALDADGPPARVSATLSINASNDLAPLIRKRLDLGAPKPIETKPEVIATTPPVETKPPEPVQPVEPPKPDVPVVTLTPPPPPPPESTFWTTRRVAGAVVGGAGVAGLATSAVMFVMASGAAGDVRKACADLQPCYDAGAFSAYSRGASLQNTGLVIAGVSAAVLAAGAVLVLLPESAPSAALVPTQNGAVFSLSGRF